MWMFLTLSLILVPSLGSRSAGQGNSRLGSRRVWGGAATEAEAEAETEIATERWLTNRDEDRCPSATDTESAGIMDDGQRRSCLPDYAGEISRAVLGKSDHGQSKHRRPIGDGDGSDILLIPCVYSVYLQYISRAGYNLVERNQTRISRRQADKHSFKEERMRICQI